MLGTPEVLVVDNSLARSEIVDSLTTGGYSVRSAATFERATSILASTPPHVLVTEVRLGAFNGLHLIIRSRVHRANTVAIVHTAYPDPVMEAEAHLLNAAYLVRPVNPSTLLNVISQRLGLRPERRTASRNVVRGGLMASIDGAPVEVTDVSESGLRITLGSGEVRSPLEVSFPALDLSLTAGIVWAQRPSSQRGALVCGVQIQRVHQGSPAAWRHFTESLQG